MSFQFNYFSATSSQIFIKKIVKGFLHTMRTIRKKSVLCKSSKIFSLYRLSNLDVLQAGSEGISALQ